MQQRRGSNRGCMMIALLGAVVVFMAMSGGLGGLLGGGGVQMPSGDGGIPSGGNEDVGIEPTPREGGLLEQVQEGVLETEDEDTLDNMFDDVTVNDVTWSIVEAADMGEVMFEELESEEGTFVGVVFEVANETSDPLTLTGLNLRDSDGFEYTYLTEANEYLGEEACGTETIEPNTFIECTAIYDVSQESTDLSAILTDLNMLGGEEKLLDLELD